MAKSKSLGPLRSREPARPASCGRFVPMVLTAALAAVLALCADTAVASHLETAKSSALESRAFCAHPSARCSTTARGGGGLRTRRRYGGANVGGRRSVLASVSGGGFGAFEVLAVRALCQPAS